jgi:hypothetical protein
MACVLLPSTRGWTLDEAGRLDQQLKQLGADVDLVGARHRRQLDLRLVGGEHEHAAGMARARSARLELAHDGGVEARLAALEVRTGAAPPRSSRRGSFAAVVSEALEIAALTPAFMAKIGQHVGGQLLHPDRSRHARPGLARVRLGDGRGDGDDQRAPSRASSARRRPASQRPAILRDGLARPAADARRALVLGEEFQLVFAVGHWSPCL